MNTQTLTPHLQDLENESIHILREVAGQFDTPALLFSGGKDSVVVFELARRAFAPAKVPFELLHVDTGHNFPEVIAFRDDLVRRTGARLHVAYVQDWIDRGELQERADGTRNPLQTVPLVETIEARGYDAVLGGARRDEERPGQKNVCFLCAMLLVVGIRAGSALNCGTFITAAISLVKTCGYSPFPTGRNRIFGNISPPATLHCLQFILPMSARSSSATACG